MEQFIYDNSSLILLLGILATIFLNLTIFFVFFYLYKRTRRMVKAQNSGLVLEGNMRKNVEEHLNEVAREELSKVIDVYQAAIDGATKQHFDGMSKALDKQVVNLAAYSRTQEEMIAKSVQAAITELTAGAKQEIEVYKNAELARLGEQVRDLVTKLSKEVLGKAINVEDHEELVLAALENAKKRGIFKQDGSK